MSLNTSDEGSNNGKKCGQKGAICGPNKHFNYNFRVIQPFDLSFLSKRLDILIFIQKMVYYLQNL